MKSMISIFLTPTVVFCFIAVNSFSSETSLQTGSRSAGMCRSSVSLTDFWSICNNQAGLALQTKPMIGLYYESRFMMTELSSKFIAGIMPSRFGVFGLNYYNFGYELYNRQKIGLAYARSFGKTIRIGVQLDYLITSIGNNYGSKNNLTFELGIQSDISENITIGAWVFNPLVAKISDYNDERIPAILRMGITWKISPDLLTTVEAGIASNEHPVILRAGIEYSIKDKYYFRSGFSTGEEIFSFGLGIVFKRISFDLSSIMHEKMGFSPQSSLIFRLK
jgi:hypothetical protein